MNITYLPALIPVLWLAGCTVHSGPLRHESSSVPRDASTSLRVEANMGAGTLHLDGGGADWLLADFAYNVPSSKPRVHYSSATGRGVLTVEQPSSTVKPFGSTRNEWNLLLNDTVPTELRVRMGAGDARLRAGSLALRGVDVEMGAGQLELDLRGTPAEDYDVHVQGGAGEATVYLPRSAGLYATAAGGIGQITARGLRKENGHWVNEGYRSAPVHVRLDIHGGVGQINLIAE